MTPAPNMTREQLVQRLRNFLTNDRLDSILEQVNSLTALQVLEHSLWVEESELPGLIPVTTTYFSFRSQVCGHKFPYHAHSLKLQLRL